MEDITKRPKPFYHRHEFQGTLAKPSKAVDNLHILVDVPEHRPGPITGMVLGNLTTSEKLASLMRIGGSWAQLRSKAYDGQHEAVRSDDVLIRTAGARRWPSEYGDSMVDVIAMLELKKLETESFIGRRRSRKKRTVTFDLAGPTTLWPQFLDRMRSYTGEAKVRKNSLPVDVGQHDNLRVELSRHFVYSNILLDDELEVHAEDSPLCVSVSTDTPQAELSDADFLNQAVSTADDLTTLCSLGSRAWVKWYRYSMHSGNRIMKHTRALHERYVEDIWLGQLMVEIRDALAFFKGGMKKMREFRQEGADLALPMATLLTAYGTDLLETEFVLLFMVLEKLKDEFVRRSGYSSNFSTKSEGKRVLRAVRETVTAQVPDAIQREAIFSKLPELERRPLFDVLELLLKEYRVEWRDLYPPGESKPRFINVRNTLMHSSQEVPIEELYRESVRLRAVVERVLLRILGWEDLHGVISQSEIDNLATR